MRVFSTYKYINEYMEDQDLSQFSHWIYNNCNKSDADGQPEVLANLTAFENSACIEQSWSVEEQRYYYKNEKGFRWLELVKGASNTNLYQSFGVYIKKCKNMTGPVLHQTNCYSNEEIHDYIVAAKNTELYVADHTIIGIYPETIMEEKQVMVLGLLWQVIKQVVLEKINLKHFPQLIRLLNEGEQLNDLLKLNPVPLYL